MVRAIELAAKEANANGGVLGREIVLEKQDTACDGQTAVNAANKLVQQEVQAVVGNFCSGAALVMQPIFARENIPYVIAGANSPDLVSGEYKNVVQSVGDYLSEVPSHWDSTSLSASEVCLTSATRGSLLLGPTPMASACSNYACRRRRRCLG